MSYIVVKKWDSEPMPSNINTRIKLFSLLLKKITLLGVQFFGVIYMFQTLPNEQAATTN